MYEKINWDEKTPLSVPNLNRMETIFDSLMESVGVAMSDINLPLGIKSQSSFPETRTGMLFYYEPDKRFKYFNGGAWINAALPGRAGL
jgi:hypothetical protein